VKVLEAFASGTPLVATPTALRGLAVIPGKHALVADESAMLADQTVRLLKDADLRQQIGRAGRAYVEQHHNLSRTTENLLQLYSEVV
jgi:glycosyltransferase involved in cell wall biosynthesis